jgi:hypothetical protein
LYESTFAPELTTTFPVVAVTAFENAEHGRVLDVPVAPVAETPDDSSELGLPEPQFANERANTRTPRLRRQWTDFMLILRRKFFEQKPETHLSIGIECAVLRVP